MFLCVLGERLLVCVEWMVEVPFFKPNHCSVGDCTCRLCVDGPRFCNICSVNHTRRDEINIGGDQPKLPRHSLFSPLLSRV